MNDVQRAILRTLTEAATRAKAAATRLEAVAADYCADSEYPKIDVCPQKDARTNGAEGAERLAEVTRRLREVGT